MTTKGFRKAVKLCWYTLILWAGVLAVAAFLFVITPLALWERVE